MKVVKREGSWLRDPGFNTQYGEHLSGTIHLDQKPGAKIKWKLTWHCCICCNPAKRKGGLWRWLTCKNPTSYLRKKWSLSHKKMKDIALGYILIYSQVFRSLIILHYFFEPPDDSLECDFHFVKQTLPKKSQTKHCIKLINLWLQLTLGWRNLTELLQKLKLKHRDGIRILFFKDVF